MCDPNRCVQRTWAPVAAQVLRQVQHSTRGAATVGGTLLDAARRDKLKGGCIVLRHLLMMVADGRFTLRAAVVALLMHVVLPNQPPSHSAPATPEFDNVVFNAQGSHDLSMNHVWSVAGEIETKKNDEIYFVPSLSYVCRTRMRHNFLFNRRHASQRLG